MKNKAINYERDEYIGGMREWGSPLRPPLGGHSSGPPNLNKEFAATPFSQISSFFTLNILLIYYSKLFFSPNYFL
jgi:hypothetical protein